MKKMSVFDLYMFSPPYGDGTMYFECKNTDIGFSPPYGDCTGLRVDGNNGWFVFAPLRGWYPTYVRFLLAEHVFAPLRGWYTKYITEDRKMEEMNA